MKVFIIAALSADGYIARDQSHFSLNWTSTEDKKMYRQATKDAGVMIMGSRTFATIGRGLPGRKTVVYTRDPDKFVSKFPGTTEIGKSQESQGLESVEATNEPPAQLLQRLAAESYSKVAVCGGSQIYDMFMQAGLVDELWLTIEPVLFGTGIPLFASELDARLELLQMNQLNTNTVKHIYKVAK